jgi:DNA-binding transcriptional MerR regulator
MLPARSFSIGALAKQSSTNPPTIRYYEQIGLVRSADRRGGGHRTYGEDDLRRLIFIRRCRELGFPIKQVRSLVGVIENRDRACMEVRDLARDHLHTVRTKLAELNALEVSLTQLVLDCETVCAGGPASECAVLEDLSRPRQAQS